MFVFGFVIKKKGGGGGGGGGGGSERTDRIITYGGTGKFVIVVCLRVPVLFACWWDGGNS